MSKTDKTRPYRVREKDVLDPAAHYEASWWGKNICGCKVCTAQYERKIDRRRERHGKRRDIEEQT